MIIDTQVHLCGRGWVTRGYLRGRGVAGGGGGGAETGISAVYNKHHGANLTPQEFHEKVMRPYVNILDASEPSSYLAFSSITAEIIFPMGQINGLTPSSLSLASLGR